MRGDVNPELDGEGEKNSDLRDGEVRAWYAALRGDETVEWDS